MPGLSQCPQVMVSDINVSIRNQKDVHKFSDVLDLYQRASSANVNWENSKALQVGQ